MTQSGPPEAQVHPPKPGALRLGRGILPSPEQMHEQWSWQRPDWPQFQWDWERLVEPLGKARLALGRLQMAGSVLEPRAAQEVLAEVLALEGVSSSAIEGEMINPASMAASVARHLGLPVESGAPLDRQAEGMATVLWDALRNHGAELTVTRLCRWHQALFPESRPDLAIGMLRPGQVHVASSVSEDHAMVHFMAVPRERLEVELDCFIAWFNQGREAGVLDGLLRAGITHLWFVTIHPFEDGNGRISRILADLALAQDRGGDPLARMSNRILHIRSEYYAALEQAQSFHGALDITPWLTWFLDQVAAACAESEGVLRRTLAKGAFWIRHRASQINERQRKALNRLLDAGPDGFQGGMTTRKYASLTHCSPITASRDLSELAELKCLVMSGGGRSTCYDLPWETLLHGP